MRLSLRRGLRCKWPLFFLVSVMSIAIGTYVAVRAYLFVEAVRAGQMLSDLAAIKLGDQEASVNKVLEKYSNIDSTSDKTGTVEVDPWHFGPISNPRPRTQGLVSKIVTILNTNPALRRRIGVRMWLANGVVIFDEHRVSQVQTEVLVEGHDEWLASMWHLMPTIPRPPTDSRIAYDPNYVVRWTHLHVGDETGQGLRTWITPSAGSAELEAARQLKVSCLYSSGGCRSFCELIPNASKYRKEHPDAPWGWTSANKDKTCQ